MEVLWLKFLILHQMYILALRVIRCKQSFLVLFASLFFIISQKTLILYRKSSQSACKQFMEVIFKRWHMAWERNEYQDHKQQMSVLLRSKINPLEVLKWFKIFWQVEANFQSSRKNSEISKNLQHMPRTCFWSI